MRNLLLTAFQKNKHKRLIAIMIFSMCLLTFASQMEIFVLGMITKKGPSFFELFAPYENGKLSAHYTVTKDQVDKRFDELDIGHQGSVSLEEANEFIKKHSKNDLIDRLISFTDSLIPLNSNFALFAVLITVVALFKAALLFIHRYSTKLMSIHVSRELREKYFEHIQKMPMSFYQKYNLGSLSNRVVGDAYFISEAVNACMINYLQTPFVLITTLTLCVLTSWQLSLFIFIGFPLIVIPIVFLAGRVKRLSKQILKGQEHFASVLIDFISGILTVKVFSMEEFSRRKYSEQNQHLANLEKRSAKYDLSSRPVVHTIGMLFLSMTILYGLYVQQLSVSEVFVFCGLLYLFYEPIKKFAEENNHIQRGIAASDRMFEILQHTSDIQDAHDAKELIEFKEKLTFDDVWFSYEKKWILKGVSFTASKGETCAIVGATGAGKSTIVQLIPRLYDPQKGKILIDDIPIQQYTQKSLREMIAFVPQRPFLFVDTVANNIAFGEPYTEEEIISAAKDAHADEFIRCLPKSYHTVLAEAGKDLSGGQQQRLSIARALVKRAPILIMDEATSSLDMLSEHRIKQAIHNLKGQVTQIIIAHRLTTIEDADKIIVIDEGKKIAEGSKNELLETCPYFKKMWEMMHHKEEVLAS